MVFNFYLILIINFLYFFTLAIITTLFIIVFCGDIIISIIKFI